MPDSTAPPAPPPPRRWSIATALAVTLAVLVTITVAAVVAPVYLAGRESTLALLRDKGELLLGATELRVREQMDPATRQLAFIAEVLGQTDSPPADRTRLADLLTGALSSSPQIASLSFVDSGYAATTVVPATRRRK